MDTPGFPCRITALCAPDAVVLKMSTAAMTEQIRTTCVLVSVKSVSGRDAVQVVAHAAVGSLGNLPTSLRSAQAVEISAAWRAEAVTAKQRAAVAVAP